MASEDQSVGATIDVWKRVLPCISVMLFVVVGVGRLEAQTTYSWNVPNTSTGTFTNAANWTAVSGTGTSYPQSADSVATPSATQPGILYLTAADSVTNWTYSTSANWEVVGAYAAASTLNISNTLTIDDGGTGGSIDEAQFVDGSGSGTLTLSIGMLALNNGRLYVGGATGTLHSITVSGLTTIGGNTTATATARMAVRLDTLTGNAASFEGGIAFGTGANASYAEDFYFNNAGFNNSASAGFLSGGNQYALVEGSSTAAVTSTLNLTGNPGLLGDSGTNSFAGIIADSSVGTLTAVQKIGNDTQAFSGANTFSGGTTISGGNLQVNNTSGSGLGAGSVTLSGGTSTTLSGNGSVTGLVTVTNGSRIAPGLNGTTPAGAGNNNFDTVGTTIKLGTAGGLTLTSANLDFDLATTTAGTSDEIQTGALSLTSVAATFNGLGSSVATGTPYVLIHYTGTVGGSASAFTGTSFVGSLAGAGYSAMYSVDATNDNIDVTFTSSTPEPGCLGVLAVGGLTLLRRRRSTGWLS